MPMSFRQNIIRTMRQVGIPTAHQPDVTLSELYARYADQARATIAVWKPVYKIRLASREREMVGLHGRTFTSELKDLPESVKVIVLQQRLDAALTELAVAGFILAVYDLLREKIRP